MAHPDYLRQRAAELRVAKRLTLGAIAERLALPKTTVWYWIKDLPFECNKRANPGQRKGTAAMRKKYRPLREQAYQQGRAEFDALVKLPTFRDFVVLYIAEGYKRSRNVASIANSDPTLIAMSVGWCRRLTGREPVVRVQHHADQSPEELRQFWGQLLMVDPGAIRLQPKSNSGQLRTRVWRCAHGVAAVDVYDTACRSRLQAWIDLVKSGWDLHSAV